MPVGGTWDHATKIATVTFNDHLAIVDVPLQDFSVDGTPDDIYSSSAAPAVAGRRLSVQCADTFVEAGPPLRLEYKKTSGSIVGSRGGTLAAFQNFPLTAV